MRADPLRNGYRAQEGAVGVRRQREGGARKRRARGWLAGGAAVAALGLVTAVVYTQSGGEEQPGAVLSATPEPQSPPVDAGSMEEYHDGIEVTAERTEFTPADGSGGDYTSVWVRVVNSTEYNLVVESSAFLLRDAGGRLRDPALGADGREIADGAMAVLAPGEEAAGTVTAVGDFGPTVLVYYPDNSGIPVIAEVGPAR